MDTSELINIIANNDIAIYGAGYAAQNFYTALKIRKLDKQVKYFVVTNLRETGREIQGVSVRAVEDVICEKNIYFCIAVHETIKNEIEEYLLNISIKKYIWVHPYIMKIALGDPVEYHKSVEVRKIMQQHCDDNYAFAIRYLAIENYYKRNHVGYDIYLKALRLQCETETAKKRFNNFLSLIEDWDKNGYRQEQAILVDENNRLVDGTHRLSLACYHKMRYIYCDIFPGSNNYYKMIKDKHFLSIDTLEKSGFSSDELEVLGKAQKRIRVNLCIDEEESVWA